MHSNNIKHIFFDLDNTLWDFSTNSKAIVEKLYFDFDLPGRGIKDFAQFFLNYKQRNEFLWDAYRYGRKNKEEVRFERFYTTLYDFGIDNRSIAMQMADYYIQHTRHLKELLPGAIETLQYLHEKYPLHIITNGFNEVQFFKIKNCGLQDFFKTITTAESANALKPDKKIFEVALRDANALAHESIYIGDSPEVDGKGALNAGMQFILFNAEPVNENDSDTPSISTLIMLKEML